MIIIFSGPSGVGKSTIINELINHKKLYFSVSHTTREKRHNEENGVDYFFISEDEFNNLINKNYFIVDYEKNKMQKRAPVTRIRLKSIKTGRVIDKNFSGYDIKLTPALVEKKKAKYLYNDSGIYYFMDEDDFEQYALSADLVEDVSSYLIDELSLELLFYENQPVSIELPTTVDLEVSETEPGYKGDTAQGGTKPAVVETGLKLMVPLFIEAGNVVKVDTRNASYVSRV